MNLNDYNSLEVIIMENNIDELEELERLKKLDKVSNDFIDFIISNENGKIEETKLKEYISYLNTP